MTILINCSNIKIGGGVQVAHSFINEIRSNSDHLYIIVLSSTLKRQLDEKMFAENFIFYNYDKKANAKNAVFSSDQMLDSLVRKYKVEKVFTVFGPSYWRPKVVHIVGYAKAHYIYTSSLFFQTMSTIQRLRLKAKGFFHLLDFKKNADILITENPDVSKRIAQKVNKKVHTVSNTYNQVFDRQDEWSHMELPPFDGKYILTIAANYPHKNLNIIPKVIKVLRDQNCKKFKFAVTVEKGGLQSDNESDEFITYLGKVDIRDCPKLYTQSHYMFLPTLLECFSASYAEAMRMEKPIITSDLDFARGLCLDAAAYFDPLNPKAIAALLMRLDNDELWQKQLIIKGRNRLQDFDSTSERANKYLQIISTS